MIIRLMSQSDLAHVYAIEQEYPSSWTSAQLASELEYSEGVSLVAENGKGEVIAWCTVRFTVPEAELLKIAVRSDLRGQGVAGMLFQQLMHVLSEKHIQDIFLEVRSQNRSAIRFYLKNGFDQVGERPGYYSDPKDNAIIFKKALF